MSDKPKLRFGNQGDSVLVFWKGQLLLWYLGRDSEDAQEFAATLRVRVTDEPMPGCPTPHLRAEWGADSSARLFLDEPPTELRHQTRIDSARRAGLLLPESLEVPT